jgi:DnaA family protein
VSAKQLALRLRLRDDETFESFHAPDNAEMVSRLEQLAAGAISGSVWLWGGPACGKSHLLQACCHRAQEAGRRAIYLPLADLPLVPDAFEDLGSHRLVCIDDVQSLAGLPDLERAFVPLFNELTANAAGIVMAASTAPAEVAFALADVASRAASASVYRVAPIDDKSRLEILRRRASLRGLTLGNEVAEFILARASRDMRALMSTLDRLDVAALREKRRLTIPFVKQVLGF